MTNELPSRRAIYWPKVPYSLEPAEPFRSLRFAVDRYHNWLAAHEPPPDIDLASLLAERIAAVAETGLPMARYGQGNGVYYRRDELGVPFASMSYKRINAVTRQALAAGLLRRTKRRGLVGPDGTTTAAGRRGAALG
jgi:hypothetical protein